MRIVTPEDSEYPQDKAIWKTAYYGDHFKKLQPIKAQYDPDNIFSYSQSIPLS